VITVNELRFHVVDTGGDGKPVLLLHGFPDTSDLWRFQVPILSSAGYRVIAPDLRGRGRTDAPPRVDDYALANLLDDVISILDALQVDRAHVVGHDWGAGIAWFLAALWPERFDHLVALSVGFPGAAGRPGLRTLQLGWYQILFLFEGVAERLLQSDDWYLFRELLQGCSDIDRYIADLSRPAALTAALNWYRANMPIEDLLTPVPQLPRVSTPTLGLWSSGDNYLTEDAMIASKAWVTSGWAYRRIEGASHWIPLDAPDLLNRCLLEFLPR
jgi:pimeloyl-ACP methyl ester carboxylesterase